MPWEACTPIGSSGIDDHPCYEHRRIFLIHLTPCVQLSASITAPNFLAPGEDLGYKVEYRHPYFFSTRDPKRTALALSIFNARKLSGVFTPGEALCPLVLNTTCLLL